MQITEEMLSAEAMRRISENGSTIYEQLKPLLEPAQNGKVVAIHIDTGDYEVARRFSDALKTIQTRHTDGLYFVTNIGLAEMDGLALRMLGSQLAKEVAK